MSQASAGAPSQPQIWRRHPIVLLRAAFLPAGGVLTLLAAWLIGRSTNGLWVRGTLILGSLVLIWRVLGVANVGAPTDQTPLSQRQGVLRRVTALVRALMAGWAVLLVTAAIVTVALAFIVPGTERYVSWVYFAWLFSVGFWFALNTIDWRNDVYILTNDRIIDRVRFPLLYDQRTEARLDQVQNVRAQQGFWGGILGFGDVIVETAGRTQAVVFLEVPNPQDIQRRIFQRIDALNEQRAAEEASRQHAQLTKWFRAYHTITGWIEILDLPEEVVFPRPIHVRWRINLGPEQAYETWLSYDTESDAQGREHANETSVIPSSGRRQFHQIVPVGRRGEMFVRVRVRVLASPGSSGPEETFASREMMVRVV